MSFGASDRILDSILVDGEYTDNMRSIRQNMATLQDKLLGQAAQVLANGNLSANQVVGTSYTPIGGTEMGITTSGGLLVLFGRLSVTATENIAYCRLMLDNEQKDVTRSGVYNLANVYTDSSATLLWAGTPAAGKHSIRLEAKASASGVTILGTEQYTALWALEFIS